MRVLVTGATGVVGTELVRTLKTSGEHSVTGVGSSDSDTEVVQWHMGRSAAPASLTSTDWDVVVHAAARTRWTQTADEARLGNILPVEALREVVGPTTHLIFLSTSHVVGLSGEARSLALEGYRNAYEWSKDHAEVLAEENFAGQMTIIRFPMVIGRRSDGEVSRFSGFYQVLSGITSGLLPAFVGVEGSPVDLVSVTDISQAIIDAMDGGPQTSVRIETLGLGTSAWHAEAVVDATLEALNRWRIARGIAPMPAPPLLDPESWERFLLPFAREHLSPLQLKTVELFSVFHPYMSMREPFAATRCIEPIDEAFHRSITYWADCHPRQASAIPIPWS